MSQTQQESQTRNLKDEEFAEVIKMYRKTRKWSQETLGDISRLSARTIQRVEGGQPSDMDTRRALAAAFEFEDIDIFNKPMFIPTPESMKAQQEEFDRQHLTISVKILKTGKELADLAQESLADRTSSSFEMDRETHECFAALVDYFRDYRDVAQEYSESSKIDIYDEMQSLIDDLSSKGASLVFGLTTSKVPTGGEAGHLPMTIANLIAFPKGDEPESIAIRRQFGAPGNQSD